MSVGNLYTLLANGKPYETLEVHSCGSTQLQLKNSVQDLTTGFDGSIFKKQNDDNLYWYTPGAGEKIIDTSGGSILSRYTTAFGNFLLYTGGSARTIDNFSGQIGVLPGFNQGTGEWTCPLGGIYAISLNFVENVGNTNTSIVCSCEDLTNPGIIAFTGSAILNTISTVDGSGAYSYTGFFIEDAVYRFRARAAINDSISCDVTISQLVAD